MPDEEPKELPTTTTSPRILRVGPSEEFATLEAAVAACTAGGEEIHIVPGEYQLERPLTIKRDLTLRRVPESEGRVQLVHVGTPVVVSSGRITMVDLCWKQRVTSEYDEEPLIDQKGGSLELRGCELEARGGACVLSQGLDPQEMEAAKKRAKDGWVLSGTPVPDAPTLVLARCRWSSKRGPGVRIEWGARGRIEECEVGRCAHNAIHLLHAKDVSINKNTVRDAGGAGIFLYGGPTGGDAGYAVEGNTVERCGGAGIEVTRECEPTVKKNTLRDGNGQGLLVRGQSRGVYEENEASGHRLANVEVTDGAHVELRRNTVSGGKHVGLLFRMLSTGKVEENDVRPGPRPGVEVRGGAAPELTRNRVRGGGHIGILVRCGGRGIYTENEVEGTALAGIHVHKRAEVSLVRNRVHGGLARGIWVESDARAELEGNVVSGNAVDAPAREPKKRLSQTWGQWARKVGWLALVGLTENMEDDPEEVYPEGYDAYAAPDYRGDFDGFGGEVVYDEPMVAEASGSTRALDAAAEAAPTAVELQVVEEKSVPASKPVSV